MKDELLAEKERSISLLVDKSTKEYTTTTTNIANATHIKMVDNFQKIINIIFLVDSLVYSLSTFFALLDHSHVCFDWMEFY